MKKFFALLSFILVLSGCGEQIDTGSRGIRTYWGEITSKEPLHEGLYFYFPIGGDIIEYECRTQKYSVRMSTYTKDMQTAELFVTVNYNLDPMNIIKLHREIGKNYKERVLQPKITNAIKDVVGQWEASKLVSNRDKAAQQMAEMLSEQVKTNYINISSVMLENIDYSDTFEAAIEAKVVATQKAEEARNRTVQVEEEAKQVVLKSEAEAKAMKIKSDALAQNRNLVSYEAVLKWDGRLPQNLYGSAPIPFLNLKD